MALQYFRRRDEDDNRADNYSFSDIAVAFFVKKGGGQALSLSWAFRQYSFSVRSQMSCSVTVLALLI